MLTEPSSSPADDARVARRERQLEMLGELAEIGMALARAAGRRALIEAEAELAALPPSPAPTPTPGRADPELVFCRLARSVRQTLALQARIEADAPRRETTLRAGNSWDPKRAEIRRIAREAAAGDPEGRDRHALHAAIDERLDEPEVETALAAGASIGVVVARICGGLRIPVDWSQQPDEVIGMAPRRPGGRFWPTDPRSDLAGAAATGGQARRSPTGSDPPDG